MPNLGRLVTDQPGIAEVQCTLDGIAQHLKKLSLSASASLKLLVTLKSGESRTACRVAYWEPAKYVAKLRDHKTNETLLLLKCDLGAGHFSQSGRFDQLRDVALEQAFLLKTQKMLTAEPATMIN